MSTNRPTRSAYLTAIVAVLALAAVTLGLALASFHLGAYPHQSRPHHTKEEIHRMEVLEPSYGKGWDSPTCKHSPRSPRCLREGGNGMMPTRGGHALVPAHDGLDDGRPVEMPGRVPAAAGGSARRASRPADGLAPA